MSAPSVLAYPGLKWLEVHVDSFTGMMHARVTYNQHVDRFSMAEKAIGRSGELLIREAYFRRAQLMAVDKVAKELEK